MLPIAASLYLLGASPGPVSAETLSVEFDSDNFDFQPLQQIDNPYWPLTPGSSFVYQAETEDGCIVNQLIVTGKKKKDFTGDYADVVAWEVEDREWLAEDQDCYEGGEYALMEETTDWYAQDKKGDIWYFGEGTEAWDHEDECPSSAGSWEAGDGGAVAGIVMLGDPANHLGDTYPQEFDAGNAEDKGKVLKINTTVTIETGDFAGTYYNCLTTKEWTPLDPGAVEHKHYCRLDWGGFGLMAIDELSGGQTVRVELIGTVLPDGEFASAGECPEGE